MNFLRQYLNVMVILLMGAGAAWGMEESVEFIDVSQEKSALYFQFVTLSVGVRFLIEVALASLKSLPQFVSELLVMGGSLILAYEARRSTALKRTLLYTLAMGLIMVEFQLT